MAATDGDQLLVERAQGGDRGAFDLLVLKYQQKIVKLVMRFVHDPTDALDVSQEAFIKAYRALPSFRGESAFYTWLYRIAINAAKNHLAAAKRRPPEQELDSHGQDKDGQLLLLQPGTMQGQAGGILFGGQDDPGLVCGQIPEPDGHLVHFMRGEIMVVLKRHGVQGVDLSLQVAHQVIRIGNGTDQENVPVRL